MKTATEHLSDQSANCSSSNQPLYGGITPLVERCKRRNDRFVHDRQLEPYCIPSDADRVNNSIPPDNEAEER
ncbi:hypothetical protein T03_2544 [Trichinella britovi]|uniref:Uncharacterized protein n=1 Tax=Trichinella britovi TaxID=45882 RepID=A0A0V1D3Z4_TRIBR|nr:hypothetical protein T03_2544 [Trichinella britovi]